MSGLVSKWTIVHLDTNYFFLRSAILVAFNENGYNATCA